MSGTERFIRGEPYFFVLTEPRFRTAQWNETSREAFFATGADYVDTVLRFALPSEFPRLALEFGCGPGRIAIPLSRRVRQVVAVDESEAMLEVARAEAQRAGRDNIDFARGLRGDERRFDLVNCSLVLQRVPKARAEELIRDLAGRLTHRGILALQFPYRARTSPAMSAIRAARRAVPGFNAAINLATHKPLSEPYQPTFTYDIGWIVDRLATLGFDEFDVARTADGELDNAIVTARRRHVAVAAEPHEEPALIKPKELLAATSIEELNAKAEEYFAGLKEWDFHLAKPFAGIDDAPAILINLAVLLQGLALAPGHTVLDFGGGSGWLSRIFTQLGCRVIVADVSESALKIARELYRRLPVIGDQPEPRFLHYSGSAIDLTDASVDRIVCFDAFHHVPNVELVLGEFARILKPGGRAGFAEPGPHHSEMPQSQFEMKTYGVLENDVDIHAIREIAYRAGFSDLRVALFNIPPYHVTLEEFDEFMRGGRTTDAWADATRASLHNVRDFFLHRAGTEAIDSRSASSLGCAIEVLSANARELRVRATNTGSGLWLPGTEPIGGVHAGCHLYRNGRLEIFEWTRAPIPQEVSAGDAIEIAIALPPLEPGTYVVQLDCVAEKVSWFAVRGSEPTDVPLTIP